MSIIPYANVAGAYDVTIFIFPVTRTQRADVRFGSRLCENSVPRKTYRIGFHQSAFDECKILMSGRF